MKSLTIDNEQGAPVGKLEKIFARFCTLAKEVERGVRPDRRFVTEWSMAMEQWASDRRKWFGICTVSKGFYAYSFHPRNSGKRQRVFVPVMQIDGIEVHEDHFLWEGHGNPSKEIVRTLNRSGSGVQDCQVVFPPKL